MCSAFCICNLMAFTVSATIVFHFFICFSSPGLCDIVLLKSPFLIILWHLFCKTQNVFPDASSIKFVQKKLCYVFKSLLDSVYCYKPDFCFLFFRYFPQSMTKARISINFFPSLLLFTFVLYLLSYRHYLTSASHKWLIYWKLFQLPSRLQSSNGVLYERSWECTDFPTGFNVPEFLVIVSSGATTVLEKTSPSRAACRAVLFPTYFFLASICLSI